MGLVSGCLYGRMDLWALLCYLLSWPQQKLLSGYLGLWPCLLAMATRLVASQPALVAAPDEVQP